MKAVRLRVENLENPIGLGNQTPRFSWNAEGGVKQTAYEVTVISEGKVLWASGKIASSSMSVVYGGAPLTSRTSVEWTVRLWDENRAEGDESTAFFEMGITASDWKAEWITGNYKPKKNVRYPVDYFRKQFSAKKIKRARLYATAKGVYDVSINGTRVEDFILAPGTTDYLKRIQYQVYDVTALIKEQNEIVLRLGDGWFRGCIAAYSVEQVYGRQTSILAQLELTAEDGTMSVISTDGTWAWCNDGPICFADLKDGEIYDARKKPSFSSKAKVVKDNVRPVASDNVYVKEHEQLKPVLLTSKTGKKVLDFGQNIAGYLAFKLKGTAGQKIRFICGEVLGENGEVDMSGIQLPKPRKGWGNMSLVMALLGKPPKGDIVFTPKQEVEFICSGGEDIYKTSFAVFGFRYVQIEGSIAINPEDFTAIAVYSDMERTGTFVCSDERINKLVENTVWSMKGNFLDVPTDCPTRERLGWTGDAQVFFNTGAYLFDTAAFFRKWLADMRDSQYANGLTPAVMPMGGVYKMATMMYKATGSSVGWADAMYLIPYRYYLRYNDKKILEVCWDMIAKYADYLFANTGLKDKKAGKENPYDKYTYEKGIHLGEWLEPEEFKDKVYGTKARHPEECTAYLHYAMATIGEIARLLGKTDYEKKCKEYAEGSKKAYHHLFVRTGALDTDRQAKLVRPLALGLLDGAEKKNAEERLEKAVVNYNYRVGTGFLSTPFLLPILTEAGKVDIAYKVLENPELPGWLAEVNAGATTVWEDWEGKLSQNHYSLGAVVGWLFEYCAGIRVVGENSFEIAPVVGGSLTHAEASYASPYGKVISRWERKEGKTVYTVEVPANTQAVIVLGGERITVESGKHTFEREN